MEMNVQPIIKYFAAERIAGVIFIAVAIIAIAVSWYLFSRYRMPFQKGIAIPLTLIAVLQLIVGTAIFFRSPKDSIRVTSYLEQSPEKIKSEEIPRMEKVMQSFKMIIIIEIILIIAGFTGFLMITGNLFWKGVSLGIALQSLATLIMDHFAQSRGKVYLEFLRSIFAN